MNGRVLLLLALVPLAGCLSEAPEPQGDDSFAVQADALEAGHAYLFHHRGGALHLGISDAGQAVLSLYDGQDIRLGSVELSGNTFGRGIDLDDRPAGDYVLVVAKLEGNLTVTSGGEGITTFHGLEDHFERVVLAEAPLRQQTIPFGAPSIEEGTPAHADGELFLQRTPVSLNILAAGEGRELSIRVLSEAGPVMEVDSSAYSTRDPASGDPSMEVLVGSFDGFNLRGPGLQYTVDAADLQGVLVLESWSYSRYIPPAETPAGPTEETPAYPYGRIPDRPVQFDVHDQAEALYAWSDDNVPDYEEGGSPRPDEEDGDAPWLILFGPDDRRIGAYQVPTASILRIPVEQGGYHVAVSRGGDVYLGTDRAPVDLQLHVLEATETPFPEQPAGQTDMYGQRSGHITPSGIPYGIAPVYIQNDPSNQTLEDFVSEDISFGCSDEGTVRLTLEGETVGFIHASNRYSLERIENHMPLDGLDWVQDGMGGSCGHTGFLLLEYHR